MNEEQTQEKTLNQKIEEEEGLGEGSKKFSADEYSTPTEILPFLFLSGVGGTERDILVSLGITDVVNVAREFQTPRFNPDSDGIIEHRVWIQDMIAEENQHQLFYQIFEIFDQVEKNSNKKCLIHCKHGRSRSATVVIAYLMYKNNWTLKQSLDTVRTKRPLVGPHRHLTVQLIEWEKEFHKVKNPTIPYPAFTFVKVHRGQKCTLM